MIDIDPSNFKPCLDNSNLVQVNSKLIQVTSFFQTSGPLHFSPAFVQFISKKLTQDQHQQVGDRQAEQVVIRRCAHTLVQEYDQARADVAQNSNNQNRNVQEHGRSDKRFLKREEINEEKNPTKLNLHQHNEDPMNF